MHIKAVSVLLVLAVFTERDLGHERQAVLKRVHHRGHFGRTDVVYNEGDERKQFNKA